MTQRDHSTHAGTVTGAIQAAQAVASEIPVPDSVTLREGDMPYWESIMHARSREEWTEADLLVAANLARSIADLEASSATLQTEGDVLVDEKGKSYRNPRFDIVETLHRRVIATYRSLQMQPTVNGKTARDMARKREDERKAREARGQVAAEQAQDDGLLA